MCWQIAGEISIVKRKLQEDCWPSSTIECCFRSRNCILKVGIFRRQKQIYLSENTTNMIPPEGGDSICAETKLFLVYSAWVYRLHIH
jgi:hypothetical protein